MNTETLACIYDGFDYTRENAERQQAQFTSILDYLTRPVFKDSIETALQNIAKMIENKPIMLVCLEKDLVIASTHIIQTNEGEQFEITFDALMYSSHHDRDWTEEEAEKALYYELMSFCKDDDAPFCDPNCSVKVDYGTTIAMSIPFPINDYLITVKFSAKVPEAVLSYLSQKGMVQSSPGYASPPTLTIVCPSDKSDIPF